MIVGKHCNRGGRLVRSVGVLYKELCLETYSNSHLEPVSLGHTRMHNSCAVNGELQRDLS